MTRWRLATMLLGGQCLVGGEAAGSKRGSIRSTPQGSNRPRNTKVLVFRPGTGNYKKRTIIRLDSTVGDGAALRWIEILDCFIDIL